MVVYYAKPPPQPITFISQSAMQNQLTFLKPFAYDILHLREVPQCVRFLIEALVVKYSQNCRDGGLLCDHSGALPQHITFISQPAMQNQLAF